MHLTTMAIHIIAGALGIILGFVALYAAKGGTLHRKSGMLFVYAMVVMSVLGAVMAAVWGVAPQSNVPAGLLTGYLTITGLVTVRAPAGWSRRLDISLMLVVLAVALFDLTLAFSVLTSSNAKIHWFAVPLSIFASIGLLAAVGDVRMMRAGGLRGTARLARHLWRMCCALLIAAFSFFIGQAKVIPAPMRIFPLLAVPPLVVLATMLYWLWRIRVRRTLRGIAIVAIPEAA